MTSSSDSRLRLAIVTESYAPLNTSAAVQLAQLANAIREAGHEPVVIVPTSASNVPLIREIVAGTEVIRLRVGFQKGDGYVRRMIYEALMPLAMRRQWKVIAAEQRLDGVIWYSPSIFHGIFVSYLKRRYGIPGYLILRDIFPDWALDLGLMSRRNPAYFVLKLVERFQYRTADVIGVQTPGNLPRVSDWAKSGVRRVEVLHNWYAPPDFAPCSIDLSRTALAGRRLFVYAGNIGPAQNMGLFLDLAEALKERRDLGFVFVGRGSDFARIAETVRARELDNVLTFDEIPSAEVPELYAQCEFGIVSLHPDHTTHNIPGKLISYVAHGLPVLAVVNPGNDLIELVEQYGVGQATDTTDLGVLLQTVDALLETSSNMDSVVAACKRLSEALFLPQAAAEQVIKGIMTASARH